MAVMAVPYPRLFSHLAENCRPIAGKTRKYSKKSADFIRAETQRLLLEDIIEPSNFSWRAQVLVVKKEQSGNRPMVIDYNRSINRFTRLLFS